MSWKHTVKRTVSATLAVAGRTGLLDRHVPFLTRHVIERLCYPGVLPQRAVPCRLRGLSVRVLCDPHNQFHRMPYWFGTLFDQGLEVFLRRVLRPGDAMIDVGANYGHFSMLAGALVHPGGVVHAFEPHPRLAALLEQHAASQAGTAPVHVWPKALSETAGTMTLSVNPAWMGGSTLRPAPNRNSRTGTFVQEIDVEVVRGDDLAITLPVGGRLIVKIDVEGHEAKAMAGMPQLLARAAATVAEVTPAWLDGPEGVARLLDEMRARGFEAWELDSLLSAEPQRCVLEEVQEREQTNVLFARPELEPSFRLGRRHERNRP